MVRPCREAPEPQMDAGMQGMTCIGQGCERIDCAAFASPAVRSYATTLQTEETIKNYTIP